MLKSDQIYGGMMHGWMGNIWANSSVARLFIVNGSRLEI